SEPLGRNGRRALPAGARGRAARRAGPLERRGGADLAHQSAHGRKARFGGARQIELTVEGATWAPVGPNAEAGESKPVEHSLDAPAVRRFGDDHFAADSASSLASPSIASAFKS